MTCEKISFYTAYNRPKTIPHPKCYKVTMEHSKHIDEKTGREYLVKDRKVHNYDLIQEGKEETLIDNIIRKCTEGNEEVLQQIQGQYIDITNKITSLMDAQNLVLQAKEDFNNLPLELRKRFDNDVNIYIAEFGTNEWNEKMGLNKAPKPEPQNPIFEEKTEKGDVTNE